MRASATILLLTLMCGGISAEEQQARPNILWLSAEDMGPDLGCYGSPDAITPTLDALAARGTRFTNAFVTAPICAPSRSAIITGLYANTLGTMHHRSGPEGAGEAGMPVLPGHIKCFPEYLRSAGYYCTNNQQQDYNFAPVPPESWDESSAQAHFKNRTNPDQPFFAVFNFEGTHESQTWDDAENVDPYMERLTPEQRHEPSKIAIPPYHPDTPRVRTQWANYHDRITALDYWVSAHLRDLDEAGLSDKTIVMFWSDHGAGLPRHKRFLHDSGTRIPLIIAVPEQWRAQAGLPQEAVDERLVSTVDFAPSVLNLLGLQIPSHMQGQPFLGPNLPAPRQYVYSARDRADERFETARSVRDARFRYIRNYQPWGPHSRYIEYVERGGIQQELRRLMKEGKLPDGCSWFGYRFKPEEELYDCLNDPHSMENLAREDAYKADLERLRGAQQKWIRDVRDLAFMPEPELVHLEAQHGSRFNVIPEESKVDPNFPEILYSVVEKCGTLTPPPVEELEPWLKNSHASVRVWAAVGLMIHYPKTDRMMELFQQLRNDPSPVIQINAALALLMQDIDKMEQIELITGYLYSNEPWVALNAANALDGADEKARRAVPDLRQALLEQRNKYVQRIIKHALDELVGIED